MASALDGSASQDALDLLRWVFLEKRFFHMERSTRLWGAGKITLPETNSSPLKIGLPNRKVVFQPSIFRGYVSFREANLCNLCLEGLL